MYFLDVNYWTKHYAKYQEDAQYVSECIVYSHKDLILNSSMNIRQLCER